MSTVSPKIELLQAEVDEETESYFRLLIDEKTVKYITVAAGVYDTDDMCFGPQLVQIPPEFPPGDWNTGHVDKRTQDNEPIFTRTERTDYTSIQNTWHAVLWDHLDLTFDRYLRTGVYEVKFSKLHLPALAKFARFDWEIPAHDRETVVYEWIEGRDIGPKNHLTRSYGFLTTKTYALGTGPELNESSSYNASSIALSPEKPCVTLDFESDVSGFPSFIVADLTEAVEIEFKYAEQFMALSNPESDGPWTFSNGLSNSFRVERFSLTKADPVQSFFVQGAQRWMTIELLSNSSVTFAKVGFEATSAHSPASELPAQLNTSNPTYDSIWGLGARANFRPRSSRAALAGPCVGSGKVPYGAKFYLTTNGDSSDLSSYVNRTLQPVDTLVFNYGWGIVNQTTLETGPNQYSPTEVTLSEDVWYTISTTISPSGYNITANDHFLAFVPYTEQVIEAATGRFGSGSPYRGTWGFGPWEDQAAWVKDVRVTAENGTTLYSNPMTAPSQVLGEYDVAPLKASVCLDGGKRDRLIWIGDFYHTARIIAASTLRYDYILGSIEHVFQWQKPNVPFKDFVPISLPMGADLRYLDGYADLYAALIDYQDLFMASVGNYFMSSADLEGLRPIWPKLKSLVQARLEYIDPSTGLVAGIRGEPDPLYFLGQANGSATTALLAYTLKSLVPLAVAMQEDGTADLYSAIAANLSEATNRHLWNAEPGIYSLSLDEPSNYSLASIAWTILSGTANSTQAASIIAKMEDLRLGVGYKSTSGQADGEEVELSANILGFVLDALFYAHHGLGVDSLGVAKRLLDDYWSSMVNQNEYRSGASWEYLYPDGSPGIDLFTSLSHPWGGAPTYVLPESVVGIRAVEPSYRQWALMPAVAEMGLEHASATTVTPFGNIEVDWRVSEGGRLWCATIFSPKGTYGYFKLPKGFSAQCDGSDAKGDTIEILGGCRTELEVRRMD
ncbi:glycoside hydrolase family 78 protein [Hortaea werneckii]|nr:glycoside hydrolase family 78 protein [Hortaea werneckii]KAI7093296.1 glycoside hydrolase family 78 protein [Hortaea werneckii]